MNTYRINEELNGIEIMFEEIPMNSTREALKANGFRWHRAKKLWYAKQTKKRLELAKVLTDTEEYAEHVRKEEPKGEKVNQYGVKVGDIFVSMWGYDQTNVDYYQVTALKGKTMVVLQAIGYEVVGHNGFMQSTVKPVRDNFIEGEEPITKKIQSCGNEPFVSLNSYANAYLTDENETHEQTSYH